MIAGAAPIENRPPQHAPIDLEGLAPTTLIEWLRTMVLIREFETAANRVALEGKIPGGMHSSVGQEGVAVGAVRALSPADIVTSSHRSHHHGLAKGLTARSVMAELYGKATGCLGGRGGSMHLFDYDRRLFGSNGIVGGGLGLAMGAALAAQIRGDQQIAVGFFGDGGANTGRVWEFVNLAALWHLPLVAICENNLYAVETYIGRSMAGESIARRAEGFGLPAIVVDGQDVVAVHAQVAAARKRALAGEGPTFIEARTYRFEGHNTGDVQNYRTREEIEEWRSGDDPIDRLRVALQAASILSDTDFQGIVTAEQEIVADSLEFAEGSPLPDPATAATNVIGIAVQLKSNP